MMSKTVQYHYSLRTHILSHCSVINITLCFQEQGREQGKFCHSFDVSYASFVRASQVPCQGLTLSLLNNQSLTSPEQGIRLHDLIQHGNFLALPVIYVEKPLKNTYHSKFPQMPLSKNIHGIESLCCIPNISLLLVLLIHLYSSRCISHSLKGHERAQ